MKQRTNRQWLLARRPVGDLTLEDFRYNEGPVPEPNDGEVLVRTLYFGFDATQRLWMTEHGGYMEPVAVGDAVRSMGIGQVVASRHPMYKEGDLVDGFMSWQDYVVLRADAQMPLRVLPKANYPLSWNLGVFEQRYSGWCVHLKAYRAVDFSGWLGQQRVGERDVDERAIVRYHRERSRGRHRPWRNELYALRQLVGFLRESGVVDDPTAGTAVAPVDVFVRRFEEHLRFHEALTSAYSSPWTFKVLQLLSRHGERYRRYAIGLADSGRDVHAEHREIFELAMAGMEARAALALEAHIRATPDLLLRAAREGQQVLPA